MLSPNEVVVVGVGLATPLGVGWAQAAAAVRAGVSAYREVAWDTLAFPPTTMATLPDEVLPDAPGPTEPAGDVAAADVEVRLGRLAALALAALGENSAGRPVPMVLGLPDPRELLGVEPGRVLDALVPSARGWVEREETRFITKGRASGLIAVREAAGALLSGGAAMVLAGGCDTHVHVGRVEALDQAERLSTEENMDGFVPGEGAGLLLLTTLGRAQEAGLEPLGLVRSVATGFEPGHMGSAEPYTGEGLAATWNELLRTHDGPPVGAVFSGMNGEHHWAKELGTASIRCKDRLADGFAVEHPADCHGDLGAATGPALVALAVWNLGRGYASGPALACCSSDLGEQAAVLLDRLPG